MSAFSSQPLALNLQLSAFSSQPLRLSSQPSAKKETGRKTNTERAPTLVRPPENTPFVIIKLKFDMFFDHILIEMLAKYSIVISTWVQPASPHERKGSSALSSQLARVSLQLSAFSSQPSALSLQLSAVSSQPLAFSLQLSAFSSQPSALSR